MTGTRLTERPILPANSLTHQFDLSEIWLVKLNVQIIAFKAIYNKHFFETYYSNYTLLESDKTWLNINLF